MKIKVIDERRRVTGRETTGKGLLSELKKKYENISMSEGKLDDMASEFNKSFSSDIIIVDGSFSKLKPIEGETIPGPRVTPTPIEYEDTETPGPSNFKPKVSSTPKVEYEDITDEESDTPVNNNPNLECDIQNAFGDMTFDFEQDVISEKVSCRKYLNEITQFISKTQDVVEDKLVKRTILLKKISKYQKKLKIWKSR